MKRRWHGVAYIVCGVALVCAYAFRTITHETKASHVLDTMEAMSAPYPPEMERLAPRYPGSRGLTVVRMKDRTSITFDAADSQDTIMAFYEKELVSRGWTRDALKPEEEKWDGARYLQGEYTLLVWTAGAVLSKGQMVFLTFVDASKSFHPSKESDSAAQAILDAMGEAYRNCASYRDEGMEVTYSKKGGEEWTDTETFRTAFFRPDRFRFELHDDAGTQEEEVEIIHSDEKGVRNWNAPGAPGVSPGESLEMAFASPSPVRLVPSLLIGEKDHFLLRLVELEAPVEETIDEVLCHRLDGKDCNGDNVSVWIEKDSSLLRKFATTNEIEGYRHETINTWKPEVNTELSEEELAFRPGE